MRSISGDCNCTEMIFTIMLIIAHILAHQKQLQINCNLILNTATGLGSVQQLDGITGSSLVPTYHSTWHFTATACHYLQKLSRLFLSLHVMVPGSNQPLTAEASSSMPPSSAEVKNKWCCICTPCMPTLWTGRTVLLRMCD